MSDDVQIISDPSIPVPSPCVVVEEHPPSPFLFVEEHPPSPKEKKRKSHFFVSTLPRRRTRSTRSTKATIGWKNIEHALPILCPLSSIEKEAVVTQEPVPSNNMSKTKEPASSQHLVVAQEPTTQEATIPQEPVMLELVVTQETAAQKETITQEQVMPKVDVTQHSEDVPLAQLFSQIEKKIKDTENSRISKLMKENESLKIELASLKKEL
jgi:hypothetical protein